MTVDALKEEISHLSEPERKQLADWMENLEEESWDRQMELDSLPGGRGGHVVERVDRAIDAAILSGELRPLAEGLRARREQSAKR